MAGVWVLGENLEQSAELLAIGRKLAEEIGTELAVFCWRASESSELIAHGADQVLLLPPLAAGEPLQAFIPVIVEQVRKDSPRVFLLAATLRGREMAARIAGQLDSGLASECQSLRWNPEESALEAERLVFGGTGIQRLRCTGNTQMATIAPRTFAASARQEGRSGNIIELPAPPPSPAKVLEQKLRSHQSGDISSARVVIGVGRGFEKEEDLELARELAQVLGGELGCTRPISQEMRWLPEETCIGLSGQQVKPDLYISLGISGQIQHLTGIRDARVICAINKDENAPIFEACDYAMVGDLYEIVPQLLAALKSK